MKFKNIKFIITIIAALLISGSSLWSQINSKRATEHSAIKDYFEKYMVTPNSQLIANSVKGLFEENENDVTGLSKANGTAGRKHYFMNGNKISTEIYNFGGIAPGYGLIRNVNNVVWHGVSYVFQFCPLVAASVPDAYNPEKQLHIVSDGLWDYPNLRDVNPTGDTLYSWEPLDEYADQSQGLMASNPADDNDGDGKPDSWPRTWYSAEQGKYVWPGYLSQDATNADQEVFWAMDDRDNVEFSYYPYLNDSTKKGLGVQVAGRALQWSNALAENTIFFVYTITNTSDKDLDTLYFGMYGDPDLGGGLPQDPTSEVQDDHGYFIPPYNYDGNHDVSKIPVYSRSMMYLWDENGVGHLGLPVGYLCCKFLESPGKTNNEIDDDGDGMINERQDDGIDNDKDWNALVDDTGIDGVVGTNDLGEGDGIPTAGVRLADGTLDPLHPGELNFELTDLDESDQIGLTSFNSWTWNTDQIKNDESMWNRTRAGNFGEIQQGADIVFIYGSGPIKLERKEIKRFSIAIILGENLDDLLVSAETVQRIYNANYRFYRPPLKPTLTAVPDDKKVTLYWDSKAEESVDPLTGKDFEGYVIYRSTDPTFNDIQTITDGKGAQFFCEALRDLEGNEAKWDVDIRPEPYSDDNKNGVYDIGEDYNDIDGDGYWSASAPDYWKGYHPVTYYGRGIQYYLGKNNGLVHSFVDTNQVINGQTYYYTVVAFDHGDSLGIPPTETTKKITQDPVTYQYSFDSNTAMVIPGPRASGYVATTTSDEITHINGISNGTVKLEILDDLTLVDNEEYVISFSDSLVSGNRISAGKNYSILKQGIYTESIKLYDTLYSKLNHTDLYNGYPVSIRLNGIEYTPETGGLKLDYIKGIIKRNAQSTIPNNSTVEISYKYYPIFQSRLLNGEDGNNVFGGVKIKMWDHDVLAIDTINTRWIQGHSNYKVTAKLSTTPKGTAYPADYEITFASQPLDTAIVQIGSKASRLKVNYKIFNLTENIPVLSVLLDKNKDSLWTSGEDILILKTGSSGSSKDVTWVVSVFQDPDTLVVPIVPTDGDVLFVTTTRPFSKDDKFTFKTHAPTYKSELAKSGLDNVIVVPNPYVGYNDIEPTNKLPGQTRGERRIYFEHLPPQCTIRIYTVAGEHVQTIEHDSNLENGREFWNLLNKDGFSIAYGVYIAHLDAPGLGEKLLKFVIIK